MPRKTVSIAKLITTVNERNESSTCDPKIREGWNSLLEAILFDADAYAGFTYLKAEDLKGNAIGMKPGEEFYRQEFCEPGPCDRKLTPVEFYEAQLEKGVYRTFPDETRRRYLCGALGKRENVIR